MKRDLFTLPLLFPGELIIDNFAGGGGTSTGLEAAFGRPVDIAINHDPEALAMHAVNHPHTKHLCESVWDVDPIEVTGNQPVGLVWLSPDCKHFSKAKGGTPVEKRIRGLAWVALRWAAKCKPRVIMLENVEEFKTWGPLQIAEDGTARPCPLRKGKTFDSFVRQLQGLGYTVDWRELRACDYGAPTIRKRFFLIARRDGIAIAWPKPTHGAPASKEVKGGKLLAWRTAAECIDWSLPCPSIFERKKPLAEATLRRVARGIVRYVINAAEPFIVPMTHTGGDRVHGTTEPLRTITTAQRGEFALAVPTLVAMGYGEREGQAPRSLDPHAPLTTITAGGMKHALVTAFMAQHNTGNDGHDARKPVSTIIAKGCTQGLVTAHITKFRTGSTGHGADEPLHTVTASSHIKRPGGAAPLGLVTTHLMVNTTGHAGAAANEPAPTITTGGHHAEVRAFLVKYYGTDQDPKLTEPLHTVTTKHRFGLVTVQGEDYQIVDIGLRMLSPRELYTAQGFPATYRIDADASGKPFTKTAQVRMCGNSVCPPLSEALVRANFSHEAQIYGRAAA